MEICITQLFNNCYPKDYSASAMELGKDAGKITWDAALSAADYWLPEFDANQQEVLREHFVSMGFEREKAATWTAEELQTLLLQLIAGDIRECGIDQQNPDWDEYEEGSSSGRYAGRIYRGDDGHVYYYIGD